MVLTENEKKILWSKLEYTKKKKAIESQSEIFQILNSENDSEVSDEMILKILNSLEYTFKKKMKETLSPNDFKLYRNLQSKFPNDWNGPKQRKPIQ